MNNTTFKRLSIGDKFISNCLTSGFRGAKFRKHNKNQGIRINENGRGDTANPVTFSRSHAVVTE
jgi:hypothetical protein